MPVSANIYFNTLLITIGISYILGVIVSVVTKRFIIGGALSRLKKAIEANNSLQQDHENLLSEEILSEAAFGKRELYRGRIHPKEKIFWRWTDMELCIRHTLDDIVNKRSVITQQQLLKISQFWEIAIEDHKLSTGPHVHMAIYLSTFFDDHVMVQKYIRNAAAIGTSSDFRFLLFCIRCGMQQHQKNEEISVQLISDFEKKKYWKSAKANSRIAEQKLIQTWKYILISRSNLQFLPNYSWEASKAISKANKSFEILIKRFPFDKVAHNAYFCFLMDIKHDTKTAAKIARGLDSEDGESIRNLSSVATSISSFGISRTNSAASIGLSRSNSSASVTRSGLQQLIQKSNRNELTIKSIVNQLENDQINSLKKLKRSIILSSLFLIFVNFIVISTHIYSLNQWNARINWEKNVASQGFYLSRIFRDTRRLQISASKTNPLDRDYATLEWSRILALDSSALFNITILTFENETIQIYDNDVPLTNAINTMIQYGSYIASINNNYGYKIATIPFIEQKALRFLLDYGKLIPKVFEVAVEKNRHKKNVDLRLINLNLTLFLMTMSIVEFIVFIQLTIPAIQNVIQCIIDEKKKKNSLFQNEPVKFSQNDLDIPDPIQESAISSVSE
ncbi:hypothetical protein HK096_007672, partial [Nowakowskiella sp. JEL0078]